MVKYPAEGKAGKDHYKKLKKGETSPIEDSDEFSEDLSLEDDLMAFFASLPKSL